MKQFFLSTFYYMSRCIYRKLPNRVKRYLDKKLKKRFFCWYNSFVYNSKYFDSLIKKDGFKELLCKKRDSYNKIIFINSAFEFDELVNQRPINAAKYFASKGYVVLFIVWQWTPEDKISSVNKEIIENVYQVGLYDYVNGIKSISFLDNLVIFLNTLPANIFDESLYYLRSQGSYIAYDIMDDWCGFNGVGQAPWFDGEYEASLILSSDYVSVVSKVLKDRFMHLRTDIEVIGNGYSDKMLGDNKNISSKESQTVGYFGHLTDSWFDWDLLFDLASKYRQINFEIIGYGEPDWVKSKVIKYSNIILLGKIHPKQLANYVKNWRIGLIPFKYSELSSAVDPIKIYEYIYFGLPVFVTGIDGVKNYPMTYYADINNIIQQFDAALSHEQNLNVYEFFLEDTHWDSRFLMMENGILHSKGIQSLYD